MDEIPHIIWFQDLSMDMVAQVGGKNASLGEITRNLAAAGVRVPGGFAVTARGYRALLDQAGLREPLRELFRDLDITNRADLAYAGERARGWILDATLPEEVEQGIRESYRQMCAESGLEDMAVAVRSSATAEDLPDASFAGQQETYLHVRGADNLVRAVHKCFASLFTDRAISYRTKRGFDHLDVALSVGVQRMVYADHGAAGVMFSIDTESGFENAVFLTAAYGLGENVVQGAVNPDEYYVFKPLLERGKPALIRRKLGDKALRMVYGEDGNAYNERVTARERNRFVLSDEEALTLARWAVAVEKHYSAVHGKPTPMDMEWARDQDTGELFMLQARPETVHAGKKPGLMRAYRLNETGEVLVSGRSVGSAIATGPVRVVESPKALKEFNTGDILVTDMTDPDWEPIMKQAAGIITNRGGRTSHAAIVSRELGIPAVVGAGNATEVLDPDQRVTLSCAEGDTGYIYAGELDYTVEDLQVDEGSLPESVGLMMNVGNPERAFTFAQVPNHGVGLARMEFVINNEIAVHPMALLHPNRTSNQDRAEIRRRTEGFADNHEFFVRTLSEGLATIAASFWPKDVIVRMSDFKSSEYANLIGGRYFEPEEENPMIGFRGASRYYSEAYREGFAMECEAIRRARDELGLTNMKIMVPFCRTVEEGEKVRAELAANGLRQGEDGLEVYIMCELPTNVILAEEFAEIFDGFSIGSNDLTQLTLGVDRNSALVSPLFDERDEAVKRFIAEAIRKVKAKGRKIGICGQAPSDYPEFAQFLVEAGIDTISVNPDALAVTARYLKEHER
ncbi:phosphoenolpyruvate synthase [Thiohalorhabdus denitrificans]|uniref:Phosphoenolpyruvate synthase n=1 Tax=Thiohalorhabdus denitrificans TaxID=381306 RepID=A0A0P9GHR1_9GAMM|nr:phosphoenolpyruvate synthase [Thiohalorhabdus denitrificans]KPV39537.1 phosphoenolpyruvate synthase [Thiohalorhabdus denitrificans]SCX99423.1 phosphoenolpyruvate synthase [Thiohalorhabdus denitrificans]